MKELLKLFLIFAKIGSVTFGGGYAMLPILQREIVEKYHWATDDELLDYFAIGQCTPGVIAVNTATFIGFKNKGILGGIFATLGVIFPSVVIITIIAAFIQGFADYPVVIHAFNGIRVCVCVLILNAVLKIAKSALVDKWTYIIFALVFVISLFTNVPTALMVIISGMLGVVIKKFLSKENKSNN
ncbi:MAG: chromate transporter [Clostridia bacterium]|nr:chromate transporter [Clostridia bacterium]